MTTNTREQIATAAELEDLILALNVAGREPYVAVVDSRPTLGFVWLKEVGGDDVVAGVTIGEPGLKAFCGLRRNQPLTWLKYPITVLYRPDQPQRTEATLPSVEDLGGVLAGWPIGSGYYRTSVGIDDAREMAEAVLALFEAAATVAEVKAEALREVRAFVLGENPEEWVRHAGTARMISGAALLEVLDDAESEVGR